MPFNKIQSEGLDLTDNYAFTGTISGASDLVLIETKTISSGTSAVEFTSGISSTYDLYQFHMIDIDTSADCNIQLDCSTNGGSSYITASNEYDHAVRGYNANNDFGTNPQTSTSQIIITYSNAQSDDQTAHPFNAIINMSAHANSSARTVFWGNFGLVHTNTGYSASGYFGGSARTPASHNAIRFQCSAGSFDSGKIKLYGVK